MRFTMELEEDVGWQRIVYGRVICYGWQENESRKDYTQNKAILAGRGCSA